MICVQHPSLANMESLAPAFLKNTVLPISFGFMESLSGVSVSSYFSYSCNSGWLFSWPEQLFASTASRPLPLSHADGLCWARGLALQFLPQQPPCCPTVWSLASAQPPSPSLPPHAFRHPHQPAIRQMSVHSAVSLLRICPTQGDGLGLITAWGLHEACHLEMKTAVTQCFSSEDGEGWVRSVIWDELECLANVPGVQITGA